MPFACIFVPAFPVEAILRAEPQLRSHPVAVLEGKPPLEKVLAVNQEARDAGIYEGMAKLQAELCDQVALRSRSELQELAAHRALLDCAQSFSPRVEDVAPDTLLLDLSGLGKLFGSLPKIARETFHRALDMGLEINIAVASTLEAALLAAHGFSGVTVVPEGKEADFLGSLPVEVLFAANADSETSQDLLQRFQQWGIKKFRDLSALPEIALTERLGQAGLDLQRKARGMGNWNLIPCDPPLIFEEAIELEYPIVLLEPLSLLLERMLDQLCARLQARALAAQELHLKLALEDGRLQSDEGAPSLSLPLVERQGGVFERTIRVPIPLLNPKTFLKLLQLDLQANPPGAPIMKVHLRIEPAKPRPSQNGFFIPSSPEPEKLELTLSRINGIVGDGRAGSPMLVNTHRRDAFEMHKFTPSESISCSWDDRHLAPAAKNSELQHENAGLITALRIFRPSIAVTVRHQNGRPSHILSHKEKQISGDVLWAAGPWRCSGDWWEQDAWMRDEWDVAVQEKTGIALYRMVHDLMDGKWTLEGCYD